VVIFAIDGLERDTLTQYLMKNAPRRPGGLHDLLGVQQDARGLLMTKAISGKQAATVFPSYTYPAWASMLTGVFPGTHGITDTGGGQSLVIHHMITRGSGTGARKARHEG
jgi:predicted AlkP superfamily pyrophosphatase or phosphodiesterase